MEKQKLLERLVVFLIYFGKKLKFLPITNNFYNLVIFYENYHFFFYDKSGTIN